MIDDVTRLPRSPAGDDESHERRAAMQFSSEFDVECWDRDERTEAWEPLGRSAA